MLKQRDRERDHRTGSDDGSQRDGSPHPGLGSAFERSVEEGEHRVGRTWPALFATGTVGGLDVGIGVFGLFVVEHETGSHLLGALAFTIGFIAMTLARSELFTENFLVPIAAMAAGRAKASAVGRLWGGTLASNLLGGWIVMGLVVAAFPELRETAISAGERYPDIGVGGASFASAVLAGMIITLMTWMEHGAESETAKLAAVVGASFLLAAGTLSHVVVISLEMFAALQAGAPFGYADWLGYASWAALGNAVGGIGLVTVLRLVQVGRRKIEEERSEA